MNKKTGLKNGIWLVVFILLNNISVKAQNDTIWKGDTMIVIHRNISMQIPEYAKAFANNDYEKTIALTEDNPLFENNLQYLIWSVKEEKDTARMRQLLPLLAENHEFFWVFGDPGVKLLAADDLFHSVSLIALQNFKKEFPQADFSYYCALSFCYVRTSLYRDLLMFDMNNSTFEKAFYENQGFLDSLNEYAIDSLIENNGLPSGEKVTPEGTNMFVLCVQHFGIESFLQFKKQMTSLRKMMDINATDYALYIDRWYVYKGRKQKYGTQIQLNEDGKYELCPVRNKKNLNKRRKNAGFLMTAEEYLNSFK